MPSTHGSIYLLTRPDLGVAYVGQSLDVRRRVARHASAGSYVTDALWKDGVSPDVAVVADRVPSADLDALEWWWMVWVAKDWTLINRTPAGVVWGSTAHAAAAGRVGGQIGGRLTGPKNGAITMRLINARATREQKQRAGRLGGAVGSGVPGGRAGHAKMTKATMALGGTRAMAQKFKCDDCALVSNAASLGSHQKSKGHTGRSAVS